MEVNNFYTATEGQDILTSIKDKTFPIPEKFELSQNYPNPFNPTTVINYRLSTESHVELTIYNQLGQQVRTLVYEKQAAGPYQIEWDGRNNSGKRISSGVYLYRLKASSFVETRKMVLLQ